MSLPLFTHFYGGQKMVIIFNKSNRPIGIAGQSVLPDQEIRVKDKDAYCAVFDEHGEDTGEKQLLPGLKALEGMKFVTIRVEEEAKPKKEVKVVEEPTGEVKKPATRKRTTKKTEE